MKLEITASDKSNPLWEKLLEMFEQRIDHLRRENDKPVDAIETAKLRGGIAELKRLINMDKEKPVVE